VTLCLVATTLGVTDSQARRAAFRARNADCRAPGQSCVDRHCRVRCVADTDCRDGERRLCGADGECIECRTSVDCGAAAPACDDRGRCVQCTTNATCPDERPVCRDGRECVECQDDQDCTDPLLPSCQDSVCVECQNDRDCTDTALPSCQDGVCVAN
jgi:hypothetical protein